jgi:hypothetical protein
MALALWVVQVVVVMAVDHQQELLVMLALQIQVVGVVAVIGIMQTVVLAVLALSFSATLDHKEELAERLLLQMVIRPTHLQHQGHLQRNK